jgi:hypothetical protein
MVAAIGPQGVDVGSLVNRWIKYPAKTCSNEQIPLPERYPTSIPCNSSYPKEYTITF